MIETLSRCGSSNANNSGMAAVLTAKIGASANLTSLSKSPKLPIHFVCNSIHSMYYKKNKNKKNIEVTLNDNLYVRHLGFASELPPERVRFGSRTFVANRAFSSERSRPFANYSERSL
ncbi:hypothetical protein DPMN_057376 [Dreissena polymorpha]|uniref:Uncharacterized protein n=1 Tax=Dreissena polymorpha TaxID=45954 RepID=A0A9D4C036_DREPO|nr:hypothetical protein DPMN_057376 [Dreissena polymorpha]